MALVFSKSLLFRPHYFVLANHRTAEAGFTCERSPGKGTAAVRLAAPLLVPWGNPADRAQAPRGAATGNTAPQLCPRSPRSISTPVLSRSPHGVTPLSPHLKAAVEADRASGSKPITCKANPMTSRYLSYKCHYFTAVFYILTPL